MMMIDDTKFVAKVNNRHDRHLLHWVTEQLKEWSAPQQFLRSV